jgi:hypothetical protein
VVASVAAASIASCFAVATSASVAKSPSRVVVIVTFSEPSNETEPVTSPASSIVRAVSSVVAVSALPVTSPVRLPTTSAVTVPAAKLPDPSRFTTLFASFEAVAVPPIRPTM